jgi:hypothetical protein
MASLIRQAVYVVDTGPKSDDPREIYVLADSEFDAAEQVAALGEPVNYVEHYSDDPADMEGKVIS